MYVLNTKLVLLLLYLHQSEKCPLWRNQINIESNKPRISDPGDLDTILLALTNITVISPYFHFQSYIFLSLNNNNTTTITTTKFGTLKCWRENVS